MIKHKNLSIFVPHAGCKNQCSFCDQRSISGTQNPPTAQYVQELCDKFLPKQETGKLETGDTDNNITLSGKDYEIAFFGGSFTAIDRQYMLQLLQAAYPFVQSKRAGGIRVSTRPDAINQEVLDILKAFGVTSIELGAQSMQDEVLAVNLRGHSQQDVVDAARLIKQNGFSLGLQMMTGMYGQKKYKSCAIDTAQKFVKLKPDTVRIYPTMTLENTLLEKFYKSGEYIPPTLEETVDICVSLIDIFDKNDIKIIKLGLHSDDNMQQKIVAGAYHPAFKELCLSKLFLEKIKGELTNTAIKECIVKVNSKQISQFKGQKNSNILEFEKLGYKVDIQGDAKIDKDNFKIETINFSEG